MSDLNDLSNQSEEKKQHDNENLNTNYVENVKTCQPFEVDITIVKLFTLQRLFSVD